MMKVRREFTFDEAEYGERRRKVRLLMAERGIHTLVLHSASNIYYLSGHYTLNLWDYQCLVLPLEGRQLMLIWHFEEGRFAATAVDTDLQMFGGGADPIAETKKALASLGALKGRIGFERTRRFSLPTSSSCWRRRLRRPRRRTDQGSSNASASSNPKPNSTTSGQRAVPRTPPCAPPTRRWRKERPTPTSLSP